MTTTRTSETTVWPALVYADAPAAVRFLSEAFGFQETLVVPGDGEGVVAHAELRWPLGGGVMLGSIRSDGVLGEQHAGVASVYVVTDEPDALFARATAAGSEVVRELRDQDFGSRTFTVKDPEGNLWSFGTYRGA
jgi:uncharacterized glyoxalase superfamily protein PhnB